MGLTSPCTRSCSREHCPTGGPPFWSGRCRSSPSSAAMVVVAATFMAIYLPSAPKQTGSTQDVSASPALDLESFRTPRVLAYSTVPFDLNSVTLSPEALATIGGLAATIEKNRGAS